MTLLHINPGLNIAKVQNMGVPDPTQLIMTFRSFINLRVITQMENF